MKRVVLALFLLACTTRANAGEQDPVVHDYGKLRDAAMFSTHCVLTDPGISGSPTVDAYSHGQVDCPTLQKLYNTAYMDAREYLTKVRKYDFTHNAPVKTLRLRVLTLAEINNPANFAPTDSQCMYSECDSGAYFGMTFYAPYSSNINVYVAYPKRSHVDWKHSFESNIKHELMHAILYRYQWNYLFRPSEEHALINRFLEWSRNR